MSDDTMTTTLEIVEPRKTRGRPRVHVGDQSEVEAAIAAEVTGKVMTVEVPVAPAVKVAAPVEAPVEAPKPKMSRRTMMEIEAGRKALSDKYGG